MLESRKNPSMGSSYENSIWNREERTCSSSDSPEEKRAFLESLCSTETDEVMVKRQLAELRDNAKAVLLEAGCSERECMHGMKEDGTWVPLEDESDPTQFNHWAIWWATVEIKNLPKEEAARDFIIAIDTLLAGAEKSEAPYSLILNALSLLGPYYVLRAEDSGIAGAAFHKVETDRNRTLGKQHGLNEQKEIINYRQSCAEECALQLWEKYPSLRGNADRTDKLIRKKVEELVRSKYPAKTDDHNIGFSRGTIARALKNLAAKHRAKPK